MIRRAFYLVVVLMWALLPVVRAEDNAVAKETPTPEKKAEVKEAQPQGLQLWLKLDETEGNKAKNSVENGVGVEIEGAKWVKEGKFGGALDFNGQDAYIVTAANMHDAFTDGNVTIAVWIFAKSGGVVADELFQHEFNTGGHDSQIELMDNGEVKVRVWSLKGLTVGKVNMNEWHHVVMRYNAKDQTLDGFVDGVKSADKITGEKQWGEKLYYAFGSHDSTNLGQGGFFTGMMDDIRVYNRVLTDDEVKSLAGAQK